VRLDLFLTVAGVSLLVVVGTETIAGAGKAIDGVVNLNTAPAVTLSLLPGVGPAKAAAIVRYRARRLFRTVDELVRIRGIGRKQVRALRPHLAVAGPSTATVADAGAQAGAKPSLPLGSPLAPPAPPPAALVRPPPRPLCRPAPPPKRRAPDLWPSRGVCPRPA
jgi:competence protein ComEA